MDTGRFRPVVFSMKVANPKRVDQQQLSLIKNSQSLSSAHLHSPDVYFLVAGCFSSGANSTNTVHATGKNQTFETRARRVTVDVIFKRKAGGNLHVLTINQGELHKTTSPNGRCYDS